MSVDDAGREQNDAFVYRGRKGENIPRRVIYVRVHPSVRVIRGNLFALCRLLMSVELHDGIEVIGERSFRQCTSLRKIFIPPAVRAIKNGAFRGCSGLTITILNDGLQEIGACAFYRCTSLVHITTPPSVRAIKDGAFRYCSGLTTAILNDGLEEIGACAFNGCTSLVHIATPPSVRAIKKNAFGGCSGLTTAILNDGLEEIGECAFAKCTSLVRIAIPPAITAIHDMAFKECPNLTNVRFCDEIEEFVSGGLLRNWWDHGVHEKCLSTYRFFIQWNIPKLVGLVLPRMWQSDIQDMLGGIPAIFPESLDSYFCSIVFKLYVYIKLKDAPALLELAIWKSIIIKRTDGNINNISADMKMKCPIDSLSMVVIILPNVLSFLYDSY
jgi:hypothetical protein